MKIILVGIDQVTDEKILDFKKEFIENNEIIHGANGLTTEKNIKKWRINIVNKATKPASNHVKTSQYFIMDTKSKLVGVIDLRHHLNGYLQKEGGHIGYSIRKSERNKGYGNLALEEVLSIAKKEFKLSKVLLTCNSKNDKSRKIIISNNGILSNKIVLNKNEIEHYWIQL